jgi:hypothetical protein
MGSGSHRGENMSDDLTLFSSPELKDIVQEMGVGPQEHLDIIDKIFKFCVNGGRATGTS